MYETLIYASAIRSLSKITVFFYYLKWSNVETVQPNFFFLLIRF